jgi:hypothetical protein
MRSPKQAAYALQLSIYAMQHGRFHVHWNSKPNVFHTKYICITASTKHTMSYLSHRAKHAPTSVQAQQFKASLEALSNAAVSIVKFLNQPAPEITPSGLGSRLALFLNSLRMHHSHTVAMGALGGVDPGELVKYLAELRQLRGSIARWLTIHAAQPKLIFVEIADFEAQCWTAMGMGVVLLDSAQAEDDAFDCVLTSRFHQWWDKLATRPAGFAA